MAKIRQAAVSVFVFQIAVVFLFLKVVYAAGAGQVAAGLESTGWGYIGAGLAVGLACIGSGYAVSRIGSAGIGAVTEKPELMGKTLVFLGLAEGIAIYGLIIAVMILNKF
jgi:V/A-type H+/Na+-transporting ATPase subunit K